MSLAVVGTEPFAQHLVETLKVHGWNVSHDASFPAWAARSADHRCLVGLPAQLNQLSYAFISFLNHLTTRTQRSSFTEFSPDQVPSQTADTEPETCDRPATPTTESTTPHIGRAA